MSARAHAATPSRRRPAARRARPAARRGGTRVKWDKIGRVALVLVLAVVAYSYLNPAIDFVKTYTATTQAKAKFHTLLDENKRLHRRIHDAKNPLAIERDARAQGMIGEGETPVVIHGLP